jgi:ferredoxin
MHLVFVSARPGSISPTGTKIAFGKKCLWCMRCIYQCPKKAIDNKYMNVFILKGGYSFKWILAQDYQPIDFCAKKVSFWHKNYRNYFTPGRSEFPAYPDSKQT